MKRSTVCTTIIGLALSLGLIAAGCSGKGTGGSGSAGAGTTIISGKVTLSGSIIGKPAMMKMLSEQEALKPLAAGVVDHASWIPNSELVAKLNAPLFETAMANAQVDMYDADHPEWLYPIAAGSTDAGGNYTLSTMTNSSKNEGATYKDGDAIPAGNYTLVAYSGFGLGQKPIVAVQSIVKNFDGNITNVDFEVLPSDVAPEVIYMFGVRKNRDGTERWGYSDSTVTASLPANSAVQVTFSMPMWRDSLKAGITISPSLSGHWSLSADWLTATYYLDPDVQMTPGQTYTITINGEDADPSLPRALNVYGNAAKLTAVGKFTASAADAIGPTVQWNSPTVIEMGGTVDVTQAFRIESNKPLDVNGIVLRGSPSIGVKPGVLYLGRNERDLYVYEFMLGEPLLLNQRYSLTVTGGRDLAGHSINTLTGSITTNDAAHTPGIDPAATADYQNLQAQVKAVFGKWVRATNDRNIAQWQSVMSGEFYMEYDVASIGIDSTTDINRDGRYSLGEFSRMLVTDAFPQWEYCGSTITGTITPTAGDYINVVPLTSTADFEFKLSAANRVNLSRCMDAAPRESLYMTLKYKNGTWKIVRGSIGIDTRDKTIDKPGLISAKMAQTTWPFLLGWSDVADGALLSQVPDNTNLRIKYSWDAATGVTAYVLILANERDPYNGFAVAFPSTVLNVPSNQDPIIDLQGIDLSEKLGFFNTLASFTYQPGGKYNWEVIGLGTATAVPDPANPNDPGFVGNKTPRDLIRDISAVSNVRRFGIAGLFAELSVEVRAGSNPSAPPITFNPAIIGYDVGSAFQATITIYTPNAGTTTGQIRHSSANLKYYDITFTNRTATVTIPLYKGVNVFSVYETGVPQGSAALSKSFWVITTGGKQRPISIWEVTDDLGNTLSGDQWDYYRAPGASKINVIGAVADPLAASLYITVSNEYGPYTRTTIATSGTGDNTFDTSTMTPPDVEIYPGNNTIIFSYSRPGTPRTSYMSRIMVYTDAGSVWVPPITISGVTAAGATSAITKTADYSTSSDWSATLDPAANYLATISGRFKTIANGRYYTSSDGGYSNGTLVVDGSGNFSLETVLFNGWNYISIYDVNNNGYWLNIYTTTGKPVIKPEITMIDGNAYNAQASNNQYADTDCSATIEGTAEPGTMWAYWNASTSAGYFNEYYEIPNTNGTFRFTVPVAGPGVSNIVDIYDAQWRRTSVTIITTGSCAYTPPTIAVTQVTDASGTVLPPSGNNYYPGTSAVVNISGTSNRPGALITVSNNICSQNDNYTTYAAADGSWSVQNVKVYGLSGGGYWNYLYVRLGNAYAYVYAVSTNTQTPTLRLRITGVTGNSGPVNMTQDNCGYTLWDAGGNTSISVSGISGLLNGQGSFTDTLNKYGQFQITNGTFSIPNIPVYNGSDNYIYLNVYNDPAGSTYHSMNVTTLNGFTKPQYVTITYPAHGSTGIEGVQTVTGTISDPQGTGFAATEVSAGVSACNTWTNYSTNPYYQQNYGYLPMTLSGSSFSLDVDFCGVGVPDIPANIDVYVYDNNKGESHYHRIYVNYGAGGPSQSYAKPGVRKSEVTSHNSAEAEAFRKRLPVPIQ